MTKINSNAQNYQMKDPADVCRENRLKNTSRVLDILMNSGTGKTAKSVGTDVFERSQYQDLYGTYNRHGILEITVGTLTAEDIWAINWDDHTEAYNYRFIIQGMECPFEAVPKIPKELMQPIRAVDNCITMKEGVYYKFTASDGSAWALKVNKYGRILLAPTEIEYALTHGSQKVCEEVSDYAHILSCFRESRMDVELRDIPQERVNEVLKELGIEKGFFTVNTGSSSKTYYYSNDGRVHQQYEYDGRYLAYTNWDLTVSYDVGDEWTIAGKKYVLNEKGQLDIPYGEDIFDVSESPRFQWKQK